MRSAESGYAAQAASGVPRSHLPRDEPWENIFSDDVDRQDFIKTLAQACQKTGFEVHAYCLMGNHLHLVVETLRANLAAAMLKQARWSESTLQERRKTDDKKVRMAGRLRRETTMSWGWIANRLQMGHWRTAANAVRTRAAK